MQHDELQEEYSDYINHHLNNAYHRPYTFQEWLLLVKGRHSQHPHERIKRA
jgi:hypothetical protein